MTPNPETLPAFNERRYVSAAEIAQACGVSVHDIETRYRPQAWAMPRDMRWDGRRYSYAVVSLHQLVDSLFGAGIPDAALALREWVKAQPLTVSEEPADRAVAVAHVVAGRDELERLNATTRRHASDREELPRSWTRDWEEAHE